MEQSELIKQAIVIVSVAETYHTHVPPLLKSLEDISYPIYVVVNNSKNLDKPINAINHLFIDENRWECGAIEAILVYTKIEEFVFLHDTVEIVDASIFDIMFKVFAERSVSFGPTWECYLGKYRKAVLDQLSIPICLSKMDAIYQEFMFHRQYKYVAENLIEHKELVVLFPEWKNENIENQVDYKWDRTNLVMSNPYIIKRKGIGGINAQ